MVQSKDPKVISELLQGKTIEKMKINEEEVVIKFTDGTFLDIDLDKEVQELKASVNLY